MNLNFNILNFFHDSKVNTFSIFLITILLSLTFATIPIGKYFFYLSFSRISILILVLLSLRNFSKIFRIEKVLIYVVLVILFFLIGILSSYINSDIFFPKYILKWIAALFSALMISTIFQNFDHNDILKYKIVMVSFIIGGIIHIAYTLIFEKYFLDLIANIFFNLENSPRASSMASGPNILGMFGSLLVSLIYVKRINSLKLFQIILLISSIIIFISGSKFNALLFLLILASSFFVYKEFRQFSAKIFLFFFLSFLYVHRFQLLNIFSYPKNVDSLNDRVIVIENILQYSNPESNNWLHIFLGVGPHKAHDVISYGHAHNWFFDLYLNVGILGLLIFIFILLYFYLSQKKGGINYLFPVTILLLSNLMSGSFGSSSISYLIVLFALSFRINNT